MKGLFVTEKLKYIATRGKNKGIELYPHRFEDRHFHAHLTNSRNDPIGKKVKTEYELIQLVHLGYHVRMSNVDKGHAPSTVKPIIV